ncbi:MAG: nitrophenyl compound nitroreductase subunit ArsF family protein [Patescibacteria group bacterium]|jgi:hypothetical protein|nr:nitrophenyl compound nitroreductase subunit ArsF family protein [Patescibacteria group bacterium]
MPNKLMSIILLLFSVVTLTGCNRQISTVENGDKTEQKQAAATRDNSGTSEYQVSSAEMVAEKLEVYYFHRTARCVSCKTIGRYTKETMEQKYRKQIEDGLIDYREINVELPENKEIAIKFKASGSSLFINRIIQGQDNIKQDANVWRLLGDEEKFKSYLEAVINSSLGI